MTKTIVFKPEFEKKLKDLKIKTKFVKNFKMKEWPASKHNSELDIKKQHGKCLNEISWFNFVRYAFNWDITPEGFDFWNKIANS